MMEPDGIAQCLERLCPTDGDDGTGKLHTAWSDANAHAARSLCENVEKYRDMCGQYQSHAARGARTSDLAYIFAREGRKLRNEYLRKVA